MMQEENKKLIDEYFKEQLFDFEISPPAGVFDKVEEALLKKKRKLWLNITISMAASFAIIIAAGVGYVVGTRQTKPQEKVVVSNQYQLDNNQKITSTHSHNIQSIASNSTSEKTGNYDNKSKTGKNLVLNGNSENIARGSEIAMVSAHDNKELITKNSSLSSKSNYNNGIVALKSRNAVLNNPNKSQRLAIPAKYLEYLLGFESNTDVHETDEVTEQNWQLGGSVAPLYSFRNIQNPNPNSSEVVNIVEASEKPLFSYAGGLNINYEHKRWRIETGVYYSRQGQNIEDINAKRKTSLVENRYDDVNNVSIDKGPTKAVVSSNSISNSNGYIKIAATVEKQYYLSNAMGDVLNQKNTSNYSSASIKQQYQYVEIPFIANYKLIDRAVEMSVSSGMSANIMIGNDLYLNTNNTSKNIGSTENVKTFNYSGIIGVAFEIPLVRSMSVKVEPRFRYNLNSIDEASYFNTHPYSFGVFSGLAYRF